MDYLFWVWLGVFVVTFIVEIFTVDLVSIWFTIGAIVPMILAATGVVSWAVQVVVFFVISALLILSLRGVTKKYITKNVTEKTNLDALIGKRFHMQSRTDDEVVGSIKIYGVTWGAIEQDSKTIEAGELVEVVRVQGNKLIVVKVEEKTSDSKKEEKEILNSEETAKENSENKEEK